MDAIIRHSVQPSEQGIYNNGRILEIQITGGYGSFCLTNAGGREIIEGKIPDYEKENLKILRESIIKTFN